MVLLWFSLCANSFAAFAIPVVAEFLTSATDGENVNKNAKEALYKKFIFRYYFFDKVTEKHVGKKYKY